MAMAIENLENAFEEMFDFITDLPSGLDGFESDFDLAFQELEELKDTLTQPNEPLTLEHLREMKDEPAYLKVFDPLLKSGWHIVKAVTEDKIIFRGWEKVYVPIDGLGITYNLYRRPPEGEADA